MTTTAADVTFSVERFEQLLAAGVIAKDDRVELLRGRIVRDRGACPFPPYRASLPHVRAAVGAGILTEAEADALEGEGDSPMTNPPHDNVLDFTEDAIAAVLPSGWRVRSQKGFRLPESQLSPDVAVIPRRPHGFPASHPTPADVALVVEVSDSTYRADTGDKLEEYAANGVPVYWVVNVNDERVEVYTHPDPLGTYAARTDYPVGTAIPLTIHGVALPPIPVSSFFPPNPPPAAGE